MSNLFDLNTMPRVVYVDRSSQLRRFFWRLGLARLQIECVDVGEWIKAFAARKTL